MKDLPQLKSKRWLLFIWAIILFSVQMAASGAEPGSVIRVGIYDNPPKLYTDENGKPGGIFVDLLREIAEKEGWKTEFVNDSWVNCLDNLKTGKIDLLPDVAFSYLRNEMFDFNKTEVLQSWSQLYVNKSSKIDKLSDLKDKRIALLEGSVQYLKFRQMMDGFGFDYTVVPARSFADAFSIVSKGDADAVVANYFYGESHFESFGLIKTTIVFEPTMLHFAVKKGENSHLIETIDRYLNHWIETPNSYYYQVLANYRERPVPSYEKPTAWFLIFSITIIVLLAVANFIFLRRKDVLKTKLLFLSNSKLKEEENKFKSYVENSPYGIFVVNENGRFIDINQAACNITGYSRNELLEKFIADLTPEEGKILAFNHFNRVVTEGRSFVTVPFLTKNGVKHYWTVDAVKISETRFIGFVQDVTEEKIVQGRMNRLGKIFDQSLNEIYLFDTETFRFIEVNPASLKNTGYTSEEFARLTPLDLKLKLTVGDFKTLIKPLVDGEKESIVFETLHYRKNGTFYLAEIHLQLLDYENEKLFLAIVLDITDRKKVEKELTDLKNNLELQVTEKTRELNERITELEHFYQVTIDRELRMEELRQELELIKKRNADGKH